MAVPGPAGDSTARLRGPFTQQQTVGLEAEEKKAAIPGLPAVTRPNGGQSRFSSSGIWNTPAPSQERFKATRICTENTSAVTLSADSAGSEGDGGSSGGLGKMPQMRCSQLLQQGAPPYALRVSAGCEACARFKPLSSMPVGTVAQGVQAIQSLQLGQSQRSSNLFKRGWNSRKQIVVLSA